MSAEITITVRNEEKKLVTNHLIYDPFYASHEEPVIKNLVEQTLKQFDAQADAIRVRINLEML